MSKYFIEAKEARQQTIDAEISRLQTHIESASKNGKTNLTIVFDNHPFYVVFNPECKPQILELLRVSGYRMFNPAGNTNYCYITWSELA